MSIWLDEIEGECKRLSKRIDILEHALKEADKFFDGWCPNAQCCASEGKKVHDQIRNALRGRQ